MKPDTRQQLEEAARIHQEKMQQRSLGERAMDALKKAPDLLYNNYTSGVVSDIRRRLVEEGWFGKTVDDVVNRQNFGDNKRQGNDLPQPEKQKETDAGVDKFFNRNQD
jgi:hypothetical protein